MLMKLPLLKPLPMSAVAIAAMTVMASAQEKWDMPAAYSGKNYVSQSDIGFAEAVTANSDGKLEIVVHPAGSLYKGSEILRAVRSGQVPIGGRYMGAHAKEDPIFGLDVVPFVATDFDDAWKGVQAGHRRRAGRARYEIVVYADLAASRPVHTERSKQHGGYGWSQIPGGGCKHIPTGRSDGCNPYQDRSNRN